MSGAYVSLITLTGNGIQTVRVTTDNQDITSRGNLFTSVPCAIDLPSDDGSTLPTLKLKLYFTPELISEVRAATDSIQVLVEQIWTSNPDVVEEDFPYLELAQVSYDREFISADLRMRDVLNQANISETYGPLTHPGLNY